MTNDENGEGRFIPEVPPPPQPSLLLQGNPRAKSSEFSPVRPTKLDDRQNHLRDVAGPMSQAHLSLLLCDHNKAAWAAAMPLRRDGDYPR